MAIKSIHISSKNGDRQKRRSLVEAIAGKAFWSYPKVAPSKVPDGKLIEKVLVYGDDNERQALLDLFPIEKIKKVWERKLIIQEPRLHDFNRQIASSFFHIPNPEAHIQKSYKKYNLYDRFSAKDA